MNENVKMQTPSAAELHTQALEIFSAFSESKDSPFLSKLVARFSKITRTFSCPAYCPQDRNNSSQRMEDMVGGFPYTSGLFPWPNSIGTGMPMQPITQLNLEGIGSILGIDLGNETLQVWGPVSATLSQLQTYNSSFLLRLIPKKSLADAPSNFYPDWSTSSLEKTPNFFHLQLDENEPVAHNPIMKWDHPLQMFGSRQNFLEMAWSDFSDESKAMGTDELCDLAEELMNCLDASPLSNESNSDYIGGFGGQKGGEYDPSYGENLLFRLNDGNGFIFAIKWVDSIKHGLKFEHAFTIRV